MAEDAVAYVSVVPSSKNFAKGIETQIGNAGDAGGKIASSGMVARFAGVASKVGAIAAGIGTALVLKSGWTRLTDIQDATSSMTVALGNASKAGKLLSKVMDVVTGTPFSYSNFASAASNLAGFGVEANKIPGILGAIADASASKGSRAQEFANRLSTSFGQMASRGVIQFDQINSLSDVGVNALAILGNAYGVTAAKMGKMVSAGAIPAAKAMAVLTDGIENGSKGVNGATTAYNGMAKALGKTSAGKLANLKTAFANLGANAIQPLIPVLNNLMTTLTQFLKGIIPQVSAGMKSVAEFVSKNQTLVLSLIGAIGGLVVVYGAWKVAKGAINFVKDIVSLVKFTATIYAHTAAWVADKVVTAQLAAMYTGQFLKGLVISTAGIIKNTAVTVASKAATLAGVVALGAATAAQWLFNAAMDANPITLLIIGIAALVAGLIWFFTQTKLGQQIWSAFVGFITTAWSTIVSAVTVAINAVVTVIQAVLAPFVAAWGAIWNVVSVVFSAVWVLLVSLATIAIWAISGVVMGVVNAIVSWWNSVWGAISAFFSVIWAAIVWAATMYVNIIRTIVTKVIGALSAWWNSVWGAISAFIATVWGAIVAKVTQGINLVRSIVASVLGAISGVWNSVWRGISSFVGSLWATIVAKVSGPINRIRSVIGSVLGSISSVWRSVWGGISSFVRGIWDGIVGFVRSGVNNIISFINGVVGAINRVADIASAVTGGAVNMHASKLPRMAAGGIVSARPGGIIANLGEGRYDEAVVPLTPKFKDQMAGKSSDRPAGNRVNLYVTNPVGEPTEETVRRNAQLIGVGLSV